MCHAVKKSLKIHVRTFRVCLDRPFTAECVGMKVSSCIVVCVGIWKVLLLLKGMVLKENLKICVE